MDSLYNYFPNFLYIFGKEPGRAFKSTPNSSSGNQPTDINIKI